MRSYFPTSLQHQFSCVGPSRPRGLISCGLCIAAAFLAACPGMDPDGDGGMFQNDGGLGVDDGGTPGQDAGSACAPSTDEHLGSLELGAAATKVAGSVWPAYTGAAAVRGAASGDAILYATTDGYIERIEGWPNLSQVSTERFDFIRSDDRDGMFFISNFLIETGDQYIAGYTGAFDANAGFASGTTSIVPSGGGGVTHLDAPGNFSAAASGDVLVVNALGLEGTNEGAGLYAYGIASSTTRFALQFPNDAAGSGFTTWLQSDDVIVAGYADANFSNQLVALSGGDVDPAAAGTLASEEQSDLGLTQVLGTATLGGRLIVQRGFYDANFAEVQLDIASVALTADGDGFSVGTPSPVLTVPDNACERILKMGSWGDDLLVVIERADQSVTAVTLQVP